MAALHLALGPRHKYVAVLKRLLNLFNDPADRLVVNDVADDATHRAAHKFRVKFFHSLGDGHSGRLDTINPQLWRMLGRALHLKGALLREVKAATDREVRSLLLGHDFDFSNVDVYTAEMEASDEKIARLFGDRRAVASANGFEPESLAIVGYKAGRFPYFRGDTTTERGVGQGHLSGYAMHMYGSTDGTRFGVTGNALADLYVPDGFGRHEGPGPQDAGMSFHYKSLGALRDVTVLFMHVRGPQLTRIGRRWKIGSIGGKNGTGPNYVHAHMDLVRGNVGLGGRRDRIPFPSIFTGNASPR